MSCGNSATWLLLWLPTSQTEQEFLRKKLVVVASAEDENESSRFLVQVTDAKEGGVDADVSLGEVEEEFNQPPAESSDFVQPMSLEENLRRLLAELKISRCTWQPSLQQDYLQVSFCVPSNRLEAVLLLLQRRGFGHHANSSVSVLPTQVHFGAVEDVAKVRPSDSKRERDAEGEGGNETEQSPSDQDEGWFFYQSIKSRLLVAEVVARVK